MLLAAGAIVLGFVLLVWSADQFVNGAAAVAKNRGMSPMMIGLTIVAFGTSAPEIFVSASAALEDATELAVGNALGSNLANIGLVLGITLFVSSIPIDRHIVSREIPFLLFVTAIGAYCLYDAELSRADGFVLLVGLGLLFTRLIYEKTHSPEPETEISEVEIEAIPNMPERKAWITLAIGLVILLISAETLVWGAKEVATHFGISQLIIGLTVIAIGTSLPELAASVASALKGHVDIALGNILGSNMLNILAVLATAALIGPSTLDPSVFDRDFVAMAAMTILLSLIIFARFWRSEHYSGAANIAKFTGASLLLAYAAYYYVLFAQTTHV